MKKLFIGILLLILSLSLVGCSVETFVPPPLPSSTYPEVVYEVSGTALMVDITLNNASGGTEQYSDVRLVINNKTLCDSPSHETHVYSWECTPTEDDYEWVTVTYSYSSFVDTSLYISAQNQGKGNGSVIVSIYVNGKLFKTSQSRGAYVIATASGRRP